MPLNNNVTRFPGGMNTLSDIDPLANLGIIDPTRYHVFMEDFDTFISTAWTVGGVGTPLRALTAGDGGLLLLTTSAAAPDNTWVQTAISFTYVNTKRLFFRARAQVDDATLAQASLGLQVAVAANVLDVPVNGLFFYKAAAAATMVLRCRAASVTTDSTTVGTIVSAQQFEVAFGVDLTSGVVVAAFQANTANGPPTVVTSFTPAALPSVAMGVVAGVQNGSAVLRTMTVDTLYCAKER